MSGGYTQRAEPPVLRVAVTVRPWNLPQKRIAQGGVRNGSALSGKFIEKVISYLNLSDILVITAGNKKELQTGQ